MDSLNLATLWQTIADLLDVLGENPYRTAAYRRGARSIKKNPLPLAELFSSGKLEKLPGIGSSLRADVSEFLETGTLSLYHKLQEQVGDDLIQLVNLGISPRLVGRLQRELGVENLGALEEAIRKQKVQSLSGIGPKREQELKRAVARGKAGMPHSGPVAEEMLQELCRLLAELPQVKCASIAGSIRRGEELAVEGRVVVATTHQPQELYRYLSGLPNITQVDNGLSAKLRGGLEVVIIPTSPESYFRTLWQETGPSGHLELVEELGTIPQEPGSEQEIYRSFSLPYIPPENRWGTVEVELAQKGKLPPPLSREQIRGDLHLHSNWSDGIHSLKELQMKGEALGFEYLAICDHSQSLHIAGGLSPEELSLRNQEIDKLNATGSSCRLLKGIELEIGAEGQLDYTPEILHELDLVVGAIHRGFGQSQKQIMTRLRRALATGLISILAHPTGRLLGRRDPLAVDLEELLDLAQKHQVALELNASPQRLDLGAENLALAKERGIPIAINTDAHHKNKLGDVRWALRLAMRAALSAEDILNTMEPDSLTKWFKSRKGGG